jgi:hypothetical protein
MFLYTPDSLLHWCLSFTAFCRSSFKVILHYRLKVERYTGDYNGYAVSIGWIGTGEMKDYILKMVYGEQWHVTTYSPTNLYSLQNKINELSMKCDLIYVERFSILPRLRGFKCIKPILNTWMPVEALEDPKSEHSTSKRRVKNKRIMKQVAEANVKYCDFRVSEHPEQLRFFYHQLYEPHISKTYGINNVESFDWMKIFYAKGVLTMAYIDGEAISGWLHLHNGDTLIECKYGIRDPTDKLQRAVSSHSSFLHYAQTKQYRFVSAFHVNPFLNDGVFINKRECGFGVKWESKKYYRDKDLYIKVVEYSQGVINFLFNNPFIFEEEGKLVANLLVDGSTSDLSEHIVEQFKRHRTVGVNQYHFTVNRELTEAEQNTIYQRCGLAENRLRFDFFY